MIGIRADTWRIVFFEKREDTYKIFMQPQRGLRPGEHYWLIWLPPDKWFWDENGIGQILGFHAAGETKKAVLLPRRMAISMAHRAGILPDGHIWLKTQRPDLYE